MYLTQYKCTSCGYGPCYYGTVSRSNKLKPYHCTLDGDRCEWQIIEIAEVKE